VRCGDVFWIFPFTLFIVFPVFDLSGSSLSFFMGPLPLKEGAATFVLANHILTAFQAILQADPLTQDFSLYRRLFQ